MAGLLTRLAVIPLTNADQLRLNLIAGLTISPQQAADRLVPADAVARIEPTVTQSFDAIEEHVGSVYRYALRLTRRPDLAEDLTQEILLRGLRSWQKLRDRRAHASLAVQDCYQHMDRPTTTREILPGDIRHRTNLPSPLAGGNERRAGERATGTRRDGRTSAATTASPLSRVPAKPWLTAKSQRSWESMNRR